MKASKRIKTIDDLIGEVPVGDQRAAGGGQQILYIAANWKPILQCYNYKSGKAGVSTVTE